MVPIFIHLFTVEVIIKYTQEVKMRFAERSVSGNKWVGKLYSDMMKTKVCVKSEVFKSWDKFTTGNIFDV